MTRCVECSGPPRKLGSYLCHGCFYNAKKDLFRNEKPEVTLKGDDKP